MGDQPALYSETGGSGRRPPPLLRAANSNVVIVVHGCSEVQHADSSKPSDDVAEQEFVFVVDTGVPGAEQDGTYSGEVYP